MENHTVVRQSSNNLSDRTIALLALQQKNSKTQVTACPTDVELTKFIQGKLKGRAREQMLAHLNQCPDCYQHWMDELRMMPKAKQPATQESDAWWRKLGKVLHLHHPWQVSTYFATLVIFVALIHHLPKSDNPPDSITAEYDALKNNELLQVNETHTVLAKPTVGLSPTQLSNGSSAYKACLENGFATLQNQAALNTQSHEQHKTVCQFGHWVALVSVALDNPNRIETAFWLRQLEQSQQFEQYFRGSSKNNIADKLQAINSDEFENLIKDPTNIESPSFIEKFHGKLSQLSQYRF